MIKARNKADWVLRTLKCRNIEIIRKLWRTLIQPHLDYACLIWSPVGEFGELKQMESVLRDYTKKCSEVRIYSYSVRLKKFGLMSQERRVERYEILYLRKMLIGKVPDLGVKIGNNSRYGPTIVLKRSNQGSDHVKGG